MNINEMMKQAKKMQQEIEDREKKLKSQEFTFTKQGIELIIRGDRKLKSIKINPALVDEDDTETLEDLIVIAFNDAIEAMDEEHEKLMPKGNGLPF